MISMTKPGGSGRLGYTVEHRGTILSFKLMLIPTVHLYYAYIKVPNISHRTLHIRNKNTHTYSGWCWWWLVTLGKWWRNMYPVKLGSGPGYKNSWQWSRFRWWYRWFIHVYPIAHHKWCLIQTVRPLTIGYMVYIPWVIDVFYVIQ